MDLEEIRSMSDKLRDVVKRTIVGQDDVIDLFLVALLAGGHVLLEGAPGTAKTLLAKSFANCMSLQFGRIQFTPDLMPGDILGTNLFNFGTNEFTLTRGPIFTELLLADEINRTPPKTQSALLEAMQERNVTIDGKKYQLGEGFMVIATQNPIEQEGTYPLPEAQLDRFLFKIVTRYPDRAQELQIVQRHGNTRFEDGADESIFPVADLASLVAMRRAIGEIRLSDEVIAYIVDIVRATRENSALTFGASPRAAAMLAVAARALAALSGRNYAIPDDIKRLAIPALMHRIVMSPGAEIEGLRAERVIQMILEQTAAPR